MGYKYYNLISASVTPQANLIGGFQALINNQFDVAPDIFTVGEELTFGSNVYVDLKVRVNTAINSETGEKLGDDFKRFIFEDLSYPVGMGRKYYFDNNYFITVFTEKIKNLVASAMVRRCNNVLRWVDTDGNYYEEPCSVDYTLRRAVNQVSTTNPVTPEGYMEVYCQLNTKTRHIKPNQRFILGNSDNWSGVYVFGFGVRNYMNLETFNNDSAQLLTLNVGVSYINPDIDNLTLGVANYYKNTYSLSPIPTAISGSSGNSIQIVPNVEINEIAVSRPMTYASSASSIATVSGSGLVTLISNGSATISMYVTANASASAIIPVVVSASATMPYEIRITPSDSFVLEGDTASISVYGYQNGIVQGDTFTFSLADSNVPTDNYILTIVDGNHITVRNVLMYLGYPLLINAVSGSNNKQISLILKGAW